MGRLACLLLHTHGGLRWQPVEAAEALDVQLRGGGRLGGRMRAVPARGGRAALQKEAVGGRRLRRKGAALECGVMRSDGTRDER